MKKYRFLVSLIVFALIVSMAGFVAASGDPVPSVANRSERPVYKSDELIVTYKQGTDLSERAAVRARQALLQLKSLKGTDMELVRINSGHSVMEMVGRLKADPGVEAVQPNFIYYPDTLPDPDNDPYYKDGSLWGMNNTGQIIGGYAGVPDIDIDAPETWAITGGNDTVVVAVIDTGIQITHPDLAGRIWTNPGEIAGNHIDDDENGYIDDINGWNFYGDNNEVFSAGDGDEHGTHCAGTIAGADNDLGVIGVAPGVRIMSLKFLGPNGGTTLDAIEAVNYARENGATLASNSWGGGGYDTALYNAIKSFGKPFIAAAGNSKANTDRRPHYPSSYDLPNIVSVASINNRGLLSSFSNYGVSSVDVGAPGEYIRSSVPFNSYAWYSGTSMATPHVSGIAALMLSVQPNLTGSQIRQILISTAVELGSLVGKTVSGGMVNAFAAVQAANGSPPPPPPADTDPPILTSVTPKNGAKSVALETTVNFIFNENIEFADKSLISVKEGKTTVSSDFSMITSENSLIITPITGCLKPGVTYTFTVANGAIKDMYGNMTTVSYSTKFTTIR